MVITNNASIKSINELREIVQKSFLYRSEVLNNIIEALVVGPRIATPTELAASPIMGYQWSSLYSGMRAGDEPLSIRRLRDGRIVWLEKWREHLGQKQENLGPWRPKILDATNYDRPKTATVKIGYVHGADGMKPGHSLSILSEPVAAGSWTLPLEIALVEVGKAATEFGAQQVAAFIRRHGWNSDDVLAVDAAYTNAPTLKPMKEAGANVLGRVSDKRVFYLPPPPYSGIGRPKVRGKKIKLSDARTLPQPDLFQHVLEEDGSYYEISRWNDIRMKQWPPQPLVLYRVIEYRADGSQRYKRPLWLIYLAANEEMPIPTPAQGQAIYDCRFSVEHSIRFMKREVGLDSGQFNGEDAETRIALWVELVATVLWMLFALRGLAQSKDLQWPCWWQNRNLTPGALRRLALALFVKLGIAPPQPQLRGKSPGRALGTHFAPRKRYRIFRKRKRRPAAR
jgi:hypothetical protein